MTSLYPVTIIRTRYGGIYEDGAWAAFNCDEWDVPPAATGCDSECEAFWRGPKAVRAGVGDTPDGAYAALLRAVDDGATVKDHDGSRTWWASTTPPPADCSGPRSAFYHPPPSTAAPACRAAFLVRCPPGSVIMGSDIAEAERVGIPLTMPDINVPRAYVGWFWVDAWTVGWGPS